jgi:uncharacterized membrane protein
MNLIRNNPRRSLVLRIIRGMAVNVVLGAICGALYGMVFGGFSVIGEGRASAMVWHALCTGTIIGTVAAVAGLFEAALAVEDVKGTPTGRISSDELISVEGPAGRNTVICATGIARRVPVARSPSETLRASA